MEGKCESSLCVLGFCFFSNTGANPDPKLTVGRGRVWGGGMARALGPKTTWKGFQAKGNSRYKGAEEREKMV